MVIINGCSLLSPLIATQESSMCFVKQVSDVATTSTLLSKTSVVSVPLRHRPTTDSNERRVLGDVCTVQVLLVVMRFLWFGGAIISSHGGFGQSASSYTSTARFGATTEY